MARPRKPATKVEFPLLEANGLYASEIRGDGNCLFNALSDQLYGHQNEHRALRDATIEHMRENTDYYQQFMVVDAVRRNPKRKVASAAASFDVTFHTLEELHHQFEMHLEKMGQPGEWADNMEVVAFASALNVHVRLWQADYFYMFSPRNDGVRSTGFAHLSIDDDEIKVVDQRPVLNIAYHTWEHYSSVRSLSGPYTGLPNISTDIKPIPNPKKRSSEERDDEDIIFRAAKRRSPLPLFDSDSTPEPSEASSDESNGHIDSQVTSDSSFNLPMARPRPRLILKLRNPKPISPQPTSPVITAASPVTANSTA